MTASDVVRERRHDKRDRCRACLRSHNILRPCLNPSILFYLPRLLSLRAGRFFDYSCLTQWPLPQTIRSLPAATEGSPELSEATLSAHSVLAQRASGDLKKHRMLWRSVTAPANGVTEELALQDLDALLALPVDATSSLMQKINVPAYEIRNQIKDNIGTVGWESLKALGAILKKWSSEQSETVSDLSKMLWRKRRQNKVQLSHLENLSLLLRLPLAEVSIVAGKVASTAEDKVRK